VKEIANILNVSDMTIRRDLQDLENDRLVKRTHGGATIPDPSRTIHDVYVVEEQTGRNVNEKSKIGLKAASFVKPNETIFLDSGTTTPFIARHLIETSDVAFDDFAASGADEEANRKILGLS